jgi:hypothetical protein
MSSWLARLLQLLGFGSQRKPSGAVTETEREAEKKAAQYHESLRNARTSARIAHHTMRAASSDLADRMTEILDGRESPPRRKPPAR